MPTAAPHLQSPLCWHGWRLDLPERWDPVKLEGDASKGMILLADLEHPHLGVRWQTLKKKADAYKAVERAMLDEVGSLAAKEAIPATPPGDGWEHGLLYTEPDPPGRDVWVGFSRTTNRVFQLAYHVRGRDRVLVDKLLPTLVDGTAGHWSIFDLNYRLPATATLTKQRLNVGDLALEFEIDKKPFVVREIAAASVTLQRQSIERWLASHQSARKKHYRPIEQPRPFEVNKDGQMIRGVARTITRRRRHFLLRRLAKTLVGVALHDESRNKILLYEAADEATIRQLLESEGTAS